MITFLFWNTCGNAPAKTIASIARAYDVDMLLLAECSLSIAEMLDALNQKEKLAFHASPSLCERITIYSRYSHQYIQAVDESDYYTVRHIRLPARQDFLLAVVHLRSKWHQDRDSQTLESADLADDIRATEKRAGTQKSLLVGDLNMNPFEPGVAGAKGLHAVMTRERAIKGDRTIAGKQYPFFYNPMWGLYGDVAEGPPGTYHYEATTQLAYFWHMFDQVLVRPELIPFFDPKTVKIIETADGINLLTKRGIPDKKQASDHLPLLFKLKL
jgi:hypothetical protein